MPRLGRLSAIERRQRRVGDLEHADEIDAVGIERPADVPVLVVDEALPVVLGHLAHGDRLVVGVGDVAAERDGRVRVVDVALAVEARIEGADEAAARIVDGGGEPALGVVAQLVGEEVLPDEPAQRRYHVDECQREGQVADGEGQHVAQRAEAGPGGEREDEEAQNANRQREQQLERADQQSGKRQHRTWPQTSGGIDRAASPRECC